MGMSDIGVQGIFLMEGLIIGIAGGIAGLAAGGLLVWYYNVVGMDMNAMMGKGYENFYASLRIEGTLRWGWNIPSFFYAFFFSIISSLVASYYPAKKTTMMQTAECLRTVQ
jgi:ABC-type lipoprotein release transport system permease subunit